jgi:hypothetical protein
MRKPSWRMEKKNTNVLWVFQFPKVSRRSVKITFQDEDEGWVCFVVGMTDGGIRSYSEKNLYHCHKSQMHWPRWNPSRRCERPAIYPPEPSEGFRERDCYLLNMPPLSHKTLRFHYREQSVNAVEGNNYCFFREHKCEVFCSVWR